MGADEFGASVDDAAHWTLSASELLQQPIDVVQLLLRPCPLCAATAEFFLDRLRALTFALFRHRHIGTFVGAGTALTLAAAERIATRLRPVRWARTVATPRAVALAIMQLEKPISPSEVAILLALPSWPWLRK